MHDDWLKRLAAMLTPQPPPPSTPQPLPQRGEPNIPLDFLSGVMDPLNPDAGGTPGSTAKDLGALLTALPVGGVTTFLRNGVPDVASRMAATQSALGKLASTLRNIGGSAADSGHIAEIAHRYPRVMAHLEDVKPLENLGALGQSIQTLRAPAGRSVMKLAPHDSANLHPSYSLPDTFAHELVHTAQRVGLKDRLDPLYEHANQELGYKFNPFEVSARAGARRRVPLPPGFIPSEPTPTTAPSVLQILRQKLGILR